MLYPPISIFNYPGRHEGASTYRFLNDEERDIIHSYVLCNCPEVDDFYNTYITSTDGMSPRFIDWFKDYESFEQLKNEKLSQGVAADDIDDSSLFIEANGGVDKKGRSWGCGSEVRFHKSSSSYGCFSRPIDPQINASQVSDLQTRLSVMEVENHTLKSNLGAMENKLNNVMSLLQKLAASQMASSESDQHRMSSFNENDDVHDDLDGGDDVHDGLSDGGDGDGDDMDDVNDSHEDDGSDNMDDGDDDSEEW